MFKAVFLSLKGDFNGHPFRGNQWSRGGVGAAVAFGAERNKRTTTIKHLLNVAFQGDKELLEEFNAALAAVDADVRAGKESFRAHIKNLKAVDSGKAKRHAYTAERLKVHNAIIDSLLKDTSAFLPKDGEAPEVIFLGGRGGSGKSSFNKSKGYDSGVYSDSSHLLLDPDKVKAMIPGYNPEKAYLSHRESVVVFDKLVSRARQKGLNVAIDITMRHPLDGMVGLFKKEGYKTQAHFMHLSPEGAVVRAASRWVTEREKLSDGTLSKRGRLVPPEVILAMVTNEKNFDSIAKKVDSSSLWANDRPLGVGPRQIAPTESSKKSEGLSWVFKANPYHDHLGRFTSHGKASSVSVWGKNSASIDKHSNNGKNALASQHQLEKVKELAHALGVHVRGGGTLSDAFGKSVLNQAQLHASGVKAYGTHAVNVVSDSYRGALDQVIANAFSTSNLSTKEKTAAGIPLTKEEEDAIAKSKEYDKKMYSKKMKAQKLSELPALIEASSAALASHGLDSAEHKKAKAKLDKAILMAQKHGASGEELSAVSAEAQKAKELKVDSALSDAKAAFHAAIKASNLSEKGELVDAAFEELSTKYSGVLSKEDLGSALVQATTAFNEAHLSARNKLSDAYAAYQPYKQNKKQGVTWETLSKALGVPKEQMKSVYDDYQAAYKEVSENYGEFAATKAVSKGKELYAAKKATGVTPISDPVQLSAKAPAKSLGEVLTGKVKDSVDTAPAKTSDIASVSKEPMKKPASKEEAMDAAKALGTQYYLLKEGKYASHGNPSSQPELAAAHALYQQAKEHYVSLGGKMDEFSSVSSSLKPDAKQALSMAKVEQDAKKQFHKQEAANSAEKLAQAEMAHKPGSKALKAAYDKHAEVVKAASEHLSPDTITTLEATGKDKHVEMQKSIKTSASTAVQSAAAALHSALLKHPKDKNHEDVLKAASHLDGILKINSSVLNKAELSAAKSEGSQIAAANHKAAKALSSVAKNAHKVVESYDKDADSFKEVTHSTTFKKHGHSQVAKLVYSEKNTLTGYTGSNFKNINRAVGAFGTAKMKGLPTTPLTEEMITTMQTMDAVFAKTTLGSNAKLRRNMPQKYFWEQLGLSLDKASSMSDDELAGFSGRVYKETAFSSTSTRGDFSGTFSSEANKTGALSLRIRAGKSMPGIHAKSISNFSGEDEVILPRGTTYVIRSIKRNPSGKFLFDVHVDMIGAFPDSL